MFRLRKISLVSFVFNLGVGNFRTSTLLKKINAGDDDGAAQELVRWIHAGGKALPGLVRRREAERTLFMK
jgi:lysozyme